MKKRFIFLIFLLCISIALTAGLVYQRRVPNQSLWVITDSIKNSIDNLEQSLAYSNYKDFYLHQKKGRSSFDKFKQSYGNNAIDDAFIFLERADSHFAYNVLLLQEMQESKAKQVLLSTLTLQAQNDNVVLNNLLHNKFNQTKEASISSSVAIRKSQIVRNYIDRLK